MHRLPIGSALFLLALASTVGAQVIHVPGDHAELQDAIDQAPPGAVIVVHGGTFESITIDRPLTLLGSPPPFITHGPQGSHYESPITLAGPGSGEVVLSRIHTGGVAVGFLYSQTSAGIVGDGFEELHVYDSDIRSPEWCCLTGLGPGRPGIDVSVPFVLVERSTVRGSATAIDDTWISSGWPGPPGIRATTSTVVVLDSTVQGGASAEFTYPSEGCGGLCPGGDGGAGVIADTLYSADSSLLGGDGARWRDPLGNTCCSSGAEGPPLVVASAIPMPNDLDADGPPRMGSDYVLHLASPGPTAALYMAEGIDAPVSGIDGELFLSGTPVALGLFATPGDAEIPIPLDTALFGREAAFQLLDPTTGYSRPVGGVLLLPFLPRLAPHAAPTETRSF